MLVGEVAYVRLGHELGVLGEFGVDGGQGLAAVVEVVYLGGGGGHGVGVSVAAWRRSILRVRSVRP